MRIFTVEHIERARSGRPDIFTLDDLNRAYQRGHDDGRSHSWLAYYGMARDMFRAHYAGDHSRCERRDGVCIDGIDERPLGGAS